MTDELQRLDKDFARLPLPAWSWDLSIDLGAAPDDCWCRIVMVVRMVLVADQDDWPSDTAWELKLPSWLQSYFMTEEQSRVAMESTPRKSWGDLPWDFHSWLDALRERDWQWWGFERDDAKATVTLKVTGMPPRIDALKQIILAAGGKIVGERYD